MLKIALPGGKSLESRICEVFADARITIRRKSGMHEVSFPDYPDLLLGRFVKPRRIPELVAEGDFDLGITGRDVIMESGVCVRFCTKLPVSRTTAQETRGVVFAHEDDVVNTVDEIPDGSSILSEYPRLTKKFFERQRKKVSVVESPGSAEAEIPSVYRFGVALSETGESLRANRLKAIGTIFRSDTLLIANKEILQDWNAREKIRALRLILGGVFAARGQIMLSMNVPKQHLEKIVALVPAITKPTLAELVGGHYVSATVVMPATKVNVLVPKLLKLGVKGLVTLPVTSVIRSW